MKALVAGKALIAGKTLSLGVKLMRIQDEGRGLCLYRFGGGRRTPFIHSLFEALAYDMTEYCDEWPGVNGV